MAVCASFSSQAHPPQTLCHLVRHAGRHKLGDTLCAGQCPAQGSVDLVRTASAGPCARPCAYLVRNAQEKGDGKQTSRIIGL